MKKTMIYLKEQQQLVLRQRAKEKGVSVAALIRDAVDDFIVRERPQVDYLSIVGMAAGVSSERTSERVDAALAAAIRKGRMRQPAGRKHAGRSKAGRAKGKVGSAVKKTPAPVRKPRKKAAGG